MNNKDFHPLPYPQTPETARAYFNLTIREGVEEFIIKPNDEEIRK